MSITKEIIIKADTSEAVTSVDGLSTSVEGLGTAAVDTSKDISGIKKASNTASKGIKGIGVAFKALGIGIVVALFAKLAEILGKNQGVMDLLSNVMKTLEIAFKDLFSFVTDNFMPAFERMKAFFENLTFKQIGEAIKNNIVERFNSVLDVIGFVGTAFKELFAGNFDKALDAIGEAGKEMVDVFTGVDGTVDKVTETVTSAAKAIGNYATETYNAADAITELGNQALIAAAINQGIIEQYDRQAEQQRQIRDDESENIEIRIKANEKLGEILEEQEKIMLANADLVIAAAANEFALNGNIENQIALIEARNEKLGIQAQIEGFRSEQLVNANSLLREQGEIEQAALDAIVAAEETKAEIRKKEEDDRKKKADDEILLAQNVANAKVNIAGNTAALIGQLVEQDSALGKGVAVAQATISGFQGVQSAFTTASASPITTLFPAYPFIQAGLAGAFSAVQIKNILKVNPKTGAGASVGGSSGGGGAAAPSFNLVEGTGSNQIAEGLSTQDKPIKAFVVSSDVSTSQSLDRNIVENSSL
jgi:hypothetical protein